MNKLPATLREARIILEKKLKGFRVSASHLVSDMVLYSISLDVLEQIMAVEILRASPVPRSAYANARSALEAAVDIVYLTLRPTDYDLRACQARSAELLELEELAKRRERADAALDELPPLPDALHADEAMDRDAKEWEARAPGKGAVFRRAFEHVHSRSTQRGHWSGLDKGEVFREIAAAHGVPREQGAMLEVIHAALSIHAHPRPRTGQRDVTVNADEARVTFNVSDPQDDAERGAYLACILALSALERRATIGD